MDQLWRAADGAARLAGEVRLIADRAASESGVDWHSVAAEAFRHRLLAESARIRACASALDEAAAAVRAYARAVREAGR